MEKEMLDRISQEYKSLGDILGVERGEGYSINSRNYILNFSSGKKAVCKYLPTADFDSLEKLLSIIRFCEKNGAKVPTILESDSGKTTCRYGTGAFYLLLFREGNIFDGSIPEVSSIARETAVLHKQLKKCKIDYETTLSLHRYRHLSTEDIDYVDSRINEKDEISDFDKYVLENIGFLRSHYENDGRKREGIDEKEITVQYIHYDLHPRNVLFNNGKTEVILDLNSIRKGELARDVAFACFRFSFYKASNREEIRKRRDAFLDSYLKENGLTEVEKRNLEYFFINECLNRISYILRMHFFENDTTWSFDLKKHINNIRTIEGL